MHKVYSKLLSQKNYNSLLAKQVHTFHQFKSTWYIKLNCACNANMIEKQIIHSCLLKNCINVIKTALHIRTDN